jgi:hypothetical protein
MGFFREDFRRRRFSPLNSYFSPLHSKEKEEEEEEEEDADSIKQMIKTLFP